MTSRPTRKDLFGEPTITTMILRAAGKLPDADLQAAWTALIRRYEDPVRSCLIHKLRGRPDAEADARSFFTYLYEHRVLPKYEREHGSFRGFIQGVIDRYAKNLTRKSSRRQVEPLVDDVAEAPRAPTPLEQVEERCWAEAVLAQAAQRLQREKPRDAQMLFMAFGVGGHAQLDRPELARHFGLSENALNVALHRGKTRLGELVREEIRSLSSSPKVFAQEERSLMARLQEAHAELVLEAAVPTGPAVPPAPPAKKAARRPAPARRSGTARRPSA